MKIFTLAALCLAGAAAQTLPADIDPQSYSRLPLISRASLSGAALATYDAVNGKDADGKPRAVPSMGPAATSMYSMGVAGPMDLLNKFVRNIKVGPAMYQLCSIIAAREFDEAYEWNSHEPGARRAGVSDLAIEAVKLDRPLTGVPAKEALVIEFGRALFRGRHKVSSELYARVVKEFGQEGMFELTSAMADYAMAAIMLRAVDQQVPNPMYPLPTLPR
jgi:4-carboxymuconolactone decarboxylase